MAQLYTHDTPMHIVIYADECEPGNPLRTDPGRLLQCIYLCFVEWPPWLLARSGAWLNLGFIRSILCKRVRAGMSGLMATMLRMFFSRDTVPSFPNGVIINTSRGPVTIDAIFEVFLPTMHVTRICPAPLAHLDTTFVSVVKMCCIGLMRMSLAMTWSAPRALLLNDSLSTRTKAYARSQNT